MRKRVPGYITTQKSDGFGLEISVERQVLPRQDMYSSGDPVPEGQQAGNYNSAMGKKFREVIPPGVIGSEETTDLDVLTPPQFIDTVEHYRGEQADPTLHGAVHSLRSAAKKELPFQAYGTFQPRTAPMPRARQDDGYLGDPATMSADPLMTDFDSTTIIAPRDIHRKDLYGKNRDGVLHNEGHGYPAVPEMQPEIKKRTGAPPAKRVKV